MSRKSNLAGLFIVVAMAMSVDAAVAQPYNLYGPGAVTCREFTVARTSGRASEVEYRYFSWAQGYISRINAQRRDQGQSQIVLLPANYGVQEQIAYLRTFCNRNPSSKYVDAVWGLYRVLESFKGLSS